MGNIDPKNVYVSFNGKDVTGFADSPVKVTRGGAKVEAQKGIQGFTEDVQKYDQIDNIKFVLMQTADSADYLENQYDARTRCPVIVRDTNPDHLRIYTCINTQVSEMGEVSVGGKDGIEFTILCSEGIKKSL